MTFQARQNTVDYLKTGHLFSFVIINQLLFNGGASKYYRPAKEGEISLALYIIQGFMVVIRVLHMLWMQETTVCVPLCKRDINFERILRSIPQPPTVQRTRKFELELFYLLNHWPETPWSMSIEHFPVLADI